MSLKEHSPGGIVTAGFFLVREQCNRASQARLDRLPALLIMRACF